MKEPTGYEETVSLLLRLYHLWLLHGVPADHFKIMRSVMYHVNQHHVSSKMATSLMPYKEENQTLIADFLE